MKKYPLPEEHIVLAGLHDVEMKKRRKTVCSSRKYKYAWMRFDTCTTITDSKAIPAITNSRDVNDFFHESVPFQDKNVEYFMVLCLDVKNQPIAVATPHIGGRSSSLVDAAVTLQAVLLAGGSAFIIAHNHPSGIAQPSEEDIELTKRLVKAAGAVGLHLLDHVVLTDDKSKYFSMLDKGMMPR
jgi:DNA repair protein RadC